MYEDIVAAARKSTEAAVRESQERVDLAVRKTAKADREATEASKAVGDRWTNRVNAMRRRAHDREAAQKSPEMAFGHEDGPHPNDHTDNDELVSLSEAPPPADATPAFGIPEELIRQQPAPTPPVWQPPAESARFIPPTEEDQRQPRRTPPPAPRRHRPPTDDDEDYSSQSSWLEGR
jgi:hypothetical protein